MVNFMVCVDGSACGNYAFQEALRLLQQNDSLLICHCVQDVWMSSTGFIGRAPINLVDLRPAQQATDAAGRHLLEWYVGKAKRLGHHNNIKAVLGVTNTEAEFICRLAKQRKIDYIVIGRRGLTGFKRFFAGSTSKLVMEQAEANVIVVHEHWPYSSQEQQKKEVAESVPAGYSEVRQPSDYKKAAEELENQRLHDEEHAIHTSEEIAHRDEQLTKRHGTSAADEEQPHRKFEESGLHHGLHSQRKFSARLYDVQHPTGRPPAVAGGTSNAAKQ